MTLVPVASTGCSFDVSGIDINDTEDAAVDDAGNPDAMDGCIPDQSYCQGDVLMTCAADGSGPVDAGAACDFICGTSQGTAQCLYASNVPAGIYALCELGSWPLTPAAGQTVTITEPTADTLAIQCSDDCGDGASITAALVMPGQAAWFCLSTVDIPAGVTVAHSGALDEAIIWVVDGAVTIAGAVDVSAGDANNATGGVRGPGGYPGVNRSNGAGITGNGPCAGAGGGRSVSGSPYAAGGGGGGGFGSTGGMGGTGQSSDSIDTAGGGMGGGTCGAATLVPLLGGSSGGTGSDGTCGSDCGWPSGGGGGALEIASRATLTITGALRAQGGDGHGETASPGGGRGGGGGGGAGGALLLEARAMALSGALSVDGGRGGQSAAGPGGAGATGGQGAANGASYQSPGHGGSGGGGGGGRIRLNTPGSTVECGAFASPDATCTTGPLSPTITP